MSNPPLGRIALQPFQLDDLVFSPAGCGCAETATCDGEIVGELFRRPMLNDRVDFFARKLTSDMTLGDWKPMRSAAEARAFIVSSRQ